MPAVVQGAALVLVAAGGTAVVLTRQPIKQAMVLGFFGLQLAVLFFTFQAPDVALSAIAVSAVALPLMIVLTLARLRRHGR
ncbi:MAG: Na(+)/H(+) antiporter subunit B [Candidatus Dormibacteraceae bacterium]